MSLLGRFIGNSRGANRKERKRPKSLQTRGFHLEPLEDRRLMTVTLVDDIYTMVQGTTYSSSLNGVLLNDSSDVDENLTRAMVVTPPAEGVLTFSEDGTFDYNATTPGVYKFKYAAQDSSGWGNSATVTLQVMAAMQVKKAALDAPRSEPVAFGVGLSSGDVRWSEPLTGGVVLDYSARAAVAVPMVTFEGLYPAGGFGTLSRLTAELKFAGATSPVVYYAASNFQADVPVHFALMSDGFESSGSGRYGWSVSLVGNRGDRDVQGIAGTYDLVDLRDSPFGAGWRLRGLQSLRSYGDGAFLIDGEGMTAWFAKDQGSGAYQSPDGAYKQHSLVKKTDGSFTLSDKFGTRWNFSSTGLLVSQVDRVGDTVVYAYIDGDDDGAADDIHTITDPFGRVTEFIYDTNGMVHQVKDFAGLITTLDHDNQSLEHITLPDIQAGDSQPAQVIAYTYTSDGRLKTVDKGLGEQWEYFYGPWGLAQSVIVPSSVVGYGGYSFAVVDALGMMPQGTGTQAVPAPLAQGESKAVASIDGRADQSYGFDNNREVSWKTDALGYQVDYARNDDGRVTDTRKADPDGPGPLGQLHSSYVYVNGNMTGETLPGGKLSRSWQYHSVWNRATQYVNEFGEVTSYEYDPANGNVDKVTRPLGRITEYDYTAHGLVEYVIESDPNLTDGIVQRTTYHYDSLGRVEWVQNPLGKRQTFTWNAADQPLTQTDEEGRTTRYEYYDDLRHLKAIYLPDPVTGQPSALPSETYRYDSKGRLTAKIQIDRDGAGGKPAAITRYEYDSANRLTKLIEPDPAGGVDAGGVVLPGPTTTYTYEPQIEPRGFLTEKSDPRGGKTHYRYLCPCQLAVGDFSVLSVARPAELTRPLWLARESGLLGYCRSQGTSRCSLAHRSMAA